MNAPNNPLFGGCEAVAPFFQALSPLRVLDALSDLGLAVDGRLSALSSYENRVYLAMLDDNSAVVAKFYRPLRWPQAAIEEEHAFATELTQQDIPVVAPLVLQGQQLHHLAVDEAQHPGFWFSVSPRRGGRQPELDDAEVLEWIGRFLARIHNVGQRSAFAQRPSLDLQTFGAKMPWPQRYAQNGHRSVSKPSPWCAKRGTRRRWAKPVGCKPFACTATVTPAIFCGPPPTDPRAGRTL